MKFSVWGKRQSIVLPLTVMVIAGFVGAYVLTRSNAQTGTSTVAPSCANLNSANPFPTLAPGSDHKCVNFLQWTLDNLTYTDSKYGTLHKSYDLALTGKFDSATEMAVKDIQSRIYELGCTVRIDGFVNSGVVPTNGTVDPMTWYFLTSMSNQPGFQGGGYECRNGNPLAN